MAKKSSSLSEYVNSISDNDVLKLTEFLRDRLPGDLAFCLDYFSKNADMDSVLSNTKTADDLYDVLDKMQGLFVTKAKKIEDNNRKGRK